MPFRQKKPGTDLHPRIAVGIWFLASGRHILPTLTIASARTEPVVRIQMAPTPRLTLLLGALLSLTATTARPDQPNQSESIANLFQQVVEKRINELTLDKRVVIYLDCPSVQSVLRYQYSDRKRNWQPSGLVDLFDDFGKAKLKECQSRYMAPGNGDQDDRLLQGVREIARARAKEALTASTLTIINESLRSNSAACIQVPSKDTQVETYCVAGRAANAVAPTPLPQLLTKVSGEERTVRLIEATAVLALGSLGDILVVPPSPTYELPGRSREAEANVRDALNILGRRQAADDLRLHEEFEREMAAKKKRNDEIAAAKRQLRDREIPDPE